MSFFSKQKQITEEDLGDLTGKIIIVTGGHSGIGYATVQYLVRKGAKVYIASRSEQTVKESIEKLEQEGTGTGTLHFLQLDLEDPRVAKNAAQEFISKEERLDILINNAGKAAGPFHLTKDGILDTMATNYIGHFVFTENLLTVLTNTAKKEGSDVRIIELSSDSHTGVHPKSFVGKDNLNMDYGASLTKQLNTYGLSKLANILHIKHLQHRLDSEGIPIICIAVHPGAVFTPNVAKFLDHIPSPFRWLVSFLLKSFFVAPRQGAINSAYAAASPEVKAKADQFKGIYLVPVTKIDPGTVEARDERLANELYETTLEVLKELGV